ncbi:MAG: hypothetical protein IIT58_10930, partial [Treponema sp.]|nr:hypothetical protein [Treponema sp.]
MFCKDVLHNSCCPEGILITRFIKLALFLSTIKKAKTSVAFVSAFFVERQGCGIFFSYKKDGGFFLAANL